MSTIMYARLTREAENHDELRPTDAGGTPAQRAAAFGERVAALVPSEVLLIYGFVLAVAVSKADDGSTTIKNSTLLKWSLPGLAALAILLFIIAKTGQWKPADWVRMLIPGVSFVAWTLLTTTSGLSLFSSFEWVANGVEFIVGAGLGAIMLALAVRYTPTNRD